MIWGVLFAGHEYNFVCSKSVSDITEMDLSRSLPQNKKPAIKIDGVLVHSDSITHSNIGKDGVARSLDEEHQEIFAQSVVICETDMLQS